jgi:hypothetical protein
LADLEGNSVPLDLPAAREDPSAQVGLEQAQDLRLAFSALILLADLLALEGAEREQTQGNGWEQYDPTEKSDRAALDAPEVRASI